MDREEAEGGGGAAAFPNESCRELVLRVAAELGFGDAARVRVVPRPSHGENFLGEIHKVEMEEEGKDGRRLKFILKTAPGDAAFRAAVPVARLFARETFAYERALRALDAAQRAAPAAARFVAARYYGASARRGEEAVLLEDLSVGGFAMRDRLASLDAAHARLAVEHLARLHAASFALRRADPPLYAELAARALHGHDYGVHFGKFVAQNRDLVLALFDGEEERPPFYGALREYLADMHAHLERLFGPEAAEPHAVLCHGDYWTSNILYKHDENGRPVDARIIDWQMMRLASPVTDLAHLIFTSTDERMRHEHFGDMLEWYYSTLAGCVEALGHRAAECFPRAAYDAHLERFMPFGVLVAIAVCPLTLCDRDELPSLVEANERFDRGEAPAARLARTPRERLAGAVRDLFKFGLCPIK